MTDLPLGDPRLPHGTTQADIDGRRPCFDEDYPTDEDAVPEDKAPEKFKFSIEQEITFTRFVEVIAEDEAAAFNSLFNLTLPALDIDHYWGNCETTGWQRERAGDPRVFKRTYVPEEVEEV